MGEWEPLWPPKHDLENSRVSYSFKRDGNHFQLNNVAYDGSGDLTESELKRRAKAAIIRELESLVSHLKASDG